MDGMDMADGDLLSGDCRAAGDFFGARDQVSRDAPKGILQIETTRGDRLFITLLGSAFINLIWLGFEVAPQPYALLACLVYAAAVFRWV
jgi:predicted small integral membrane protein